MTENSDSGFREINQNGSTDISQHTKSETQSPQPSLRNKHQNESSVSSIEESKLDNDSVSPSNSRSVSKSFGSDTGSSSSDDDDDSDDDDYDGGKPSVLNWVSLMETLINSCVRYLKMTFLDNCRFVSKCRKELIPVTSSKFFCIIFISQKT